MLGVQTDEANCCLQMATRKTSLKLPDSTAFHRCHPAARLALKCLFKFRHVHDDPVDSVLRRRVWVTNRKHPQLLRTLVSTGPLRKPDEKALVGSKFVNRSELFVLCSPLPSDVSQD